jgi:hypothetical protein
MEENYYNKYLKYKEKYEELKKKNLDLLSSNSKKKLNDMNRDPKTKTWKDLEFGLTMLTSKKVNKKYKSSIFRIIRNAVLIATKTFIPGAGLVSNLIENNKNTANIFKHLQFNDFIFSKFNQSKDHLHLKKLLELVDIDDDFIEIINPNIMKEFMLKISNLISNQSRNNPNFLNQEIPDLDEELIDFIWHKYNVDLTEISIKKNKKRRNKEFITSDNDNISYLKSLLKEREKINQTRVKNLEKIKNHYQDSNFFLGNITGLK